MDDDPDDEAVRGERAREREKEEKENTGTNRLS